MPRLSPKQAIVLSVLAALASCAKPPPAANVPTVAAYVPPPLPTPPSAPWCARPDEQTAFAETALKSDLMVIAVSCHEDEKYNAFMRRFMPVLRDAQKVTDNYFRRNNSRSWQKERDDYITLLANDQSDRAVVLGDQFCSRSGGAFSSAMGLSSVSDLGGYATSQVASVPQAMAFTDCPASTAERHRPEPRKAKKTAR